MGKHSPEDWLDLRRDADSGIETVRAYFAGHAFDPHWHDEYLIGVTEQGSQHFTCRRQHLVCTPGQSFLLEPGEIHDGEARHREGFTYRLLSLPKSLLQQQMGSLFEHSPDQFELHIEATLSTHRPLSLAIAHAFLCLHQGEPQVLRQASLDHVLAQLSKQLHWRKRSAYHVANPVLAWRAREYLHAHLQQDIGLVEAAEALGCDRYRLHRAFKQAFGVAPHAYLVQLRLVSARQWLRAGQPPAEVAHRLCFADQSHLGRWFKRAYRLTPKQYQQRCTN